jgi:aryl-alcohol dehydrogenase-like predicted oxidoreductase
MAANLSTSVAALVCAWTIRQPGVTSALVGALHPEQIRESAAAQELTLTPDIMAQINRLISEHGRCLKVEKT